MPSHSEPLSSEVISPRSRFYRSPYGRMFRNLPPHVPTFDLVKEILIEELPEDIVDNVEEILEITDPNIREEMFETIAQRRHADTRATLSKIRAALQNTEAGRETILKILAKTMIETSEQSRDPARDNPDIPAGYTYFLQFITHDITFDPTSSLMRFNDPNKIRNFRTPRLDLDSLYGGGPDDSPFMYNYDSHHNPNDLNPCDPGPSDYDPSHPNQRYYLLVGKGKNGKEDDLPRNARGRALIGDPRNDENIMISQLQLAFIKFHNMIMDELLASQKTNAKQAFQEAQRLVRWHYQWVILHDVLPRFVDRKILKEILCSSDCPSQPKLCFYQWRDQPFIPVEFAAAVFRFGHSMIRFRYRLNEGVRKLTIHSDLSHPSPTDDLQGFSVLPSDWTIDWDFFLNINHQSKLQNSRQIDTQLSNILGKLPSDLGGGDDRSLATQDLLRGYRMELPSGQAVARAMGDEPLEGPEEPLWYYVLREARELRQGRKLGPVGGRIVAEVLIGLLAGDPHSFLNVDPGWQPTCSSLGSNFGLRDIVYPTKVA